PRPATLRPQRSRVGGTTGRPSVTPLSNQISMSFMYSACEGRAMLPQFAVSRPDMGPVLRSGILIPRSAGPSVRVAAESLRAQIGEKIGGRWRRSRYWRRPARARHLLGNTRDLVGARPEMLDS